MVVVYGTVCRDRVHRVSRLPDPGGYVEIEEETECVGGEAVNTALSLLKWGAAFRFGGNSTGSASLRSMLEERGLDTAYLSNDVHLEPVCDIYVARDGQRTMFGRGFRGMGQWGNLKLVPLSPGEWFTLDANHGPEGDEAVTVAKSTGLRTYVQDLVQEEQPVGDFFQSSTDWAGFRGDVDENMAWLDSWIKRRGGYGILSDGANGFVAGGKDHFGHDHPVRHFPSFPCPHSVDSTGAGDVFRAGMLMGLSDNWPLADCLRFASAAGSLNCMGFGANAHIPAASDVKRLISRWPEVSSVYE